MNILFLTMSNGLQNIQARGIYNDLIRKFRNEGHHIYIIYPNERRYKLPNKITHSEGIHCLGVKTLNLQKTNIIEKGIGQLLLENQFKNAIKKHFADIHFDLILYSTPPITFTQTIQYVKKINPKVQTYLLLKDIFPQNAVDMKMLKKNGIKGILYKFFRHKEKKLYTISDFIGCMSPANVKYILKHNPEINPNKIEIAPNSIELTNEVLEEKSRQEILRKYHLPCDKPIFIYGGNLGIPQGIPFLIRCLEANRNRTDCHFVIVGNGTYFNLLNNWHKTSNPQNVTLIKGVPKEEYDQLVQSCHIGLIFLDYNFTIPNYPSRLLSYLEYKMPILCCTDPNCDMGPIADQNGYGFYCPSNNVEAFTQTINKILSADIKQMGENGYLFLQKNYTVEHTYNTIIKHFKNYHPITE